MPTTVPIVKAQAEDTSPGCIPVELKLLNGLGLHIEVVRPLSLSGYQGHLLLVRSQFVARLRFFSLPPILPNDMPDSLVHLIVLAKIYDAASHALPGCLRQDNSTLDPKLWEMIMLFQN